MGLFGNKTKSKKHKNQEIEPEKTSLYILMDAPKIGLVQYMRENGIEIKGIFYDIVEANYAFMQEDESARIVVIDTGTGLFSKVSNREELVSLLGMCIGNKKGIVFYTDTALKTTVHKAMPKTMLLKYVSTLEIVKTLQKFNEEYCYGGAEDEVVEELLQFKGERVECIEINQTIPTINIIDGVLGDEEDTVVTFNVKY